jgi:hypothetical protein
MLTERCRVAVGVAIWAAAVPSSDLFARSSGIPLDQSPTAGDSPARRICPGEVPAALLPASGGLQLRILRFYRARDGTTEVWAFLPVPPTATSPDPGYGIAVRVKDSTDRILHAESWPGRPRFGPPGTRPLETLHFVAAPGAYHLDVDVLDSGTARPRHGTFDFRAYADDPGASDLLLASLIRLDSSLDDPLASGEFRHGTSVVTPAAMLCVSPDQARVFYLLETYQGGMEGQAGTMEASVMDSTGRVLAHTPPVGVVMGAGGGVLRGQVGVEGLPPGTYALRIQAKVGGRALEREAPFLVDSMRPAPREAAAVLQRLVNAQQ